MSKLLFSVLLLTSVSCLGQRSSSVPDIEKFVKLIDSFPLSKTKVLKIDSSTTSTFYQTHFCNPKTNKYILKVVETDTAFGKDIIVYYIVDKELIKVETMIEDNVSSSPHNRRDYYFSKNKPLYYNSEDKARNNDSYMEFHTKAKYYIKVYKESKL